MKLLAVAGASGGHIFPALSFLEELEGRQGINASLVIPQSGQRFKPASSNKYTVKYLKAPAIKLKCDFLIFAGIFRFLKYSLASLVLLCKFRPDIVVGFGTLYSLPFVFFAWLFRINTLIHEQNVIPGRATSFLARVADKVAVSFSDTQKYLKCEKNKVIFTGNPIRKRLKPVDRRSALDYFGFKEDKFTILVMGGSQGSSHINRSFYNSLSTLPDRAGLQVIHLTGDKDYRQLIRDYSALDVNVKLFSFLQDMQYAYSACDLIICRSGATTISELINFRLPAILIPYPFAQRHQLANAKVLENSGCAVIIKDYGLEAVKLAQVIHRFMRSKADIELMRSHYLRIIKPDASKLLVEEVLKFS